jgi:hypothetical protein
VRYVSGNPYTPVLGGAFDADAGAYAPIEAVPILRSRLPEFFSIDARLEKAWSVGAAGRIAAYVDVLNVLDHRNVEATTTNFDATATTYVKGFPILPIVGVRGEVGRVDEAGEAAAP